MVFSKGKIMLIYGASILASYPIINVVRFPKYKNDDPRPDRTIIITGANGNLGSAMTYEFARRNCRVIMACRNMDKCKEIRREIVLLTKNKSIACRHLDLESIDSINEFVDNICKTEPHIDVLINNAAVKKTKTRQLTQYGLEKQFFVNFLGPYLLTTRLLPKLEESSEVTQDSRIINVTGIPKKYWKINLADINFDNRKYSDKEAYQQSKLALVYYTILLDKLNRQKDNHIYVFGTTPGAFSIIPAFTHETDPSKQIAFFVKYSFSASPRQVVQTAVKCALEKSLTSDGGSGKLYNYLLSPLGRHNGWRLAFDETKAKIVWNYAAELLLNIPDQPDSNKASDVDESAKTNTGLGEDEIISEVPLYLP